MKPLNNLVVISWHTPWKCVRVLIGTTSIRLSEDNHDSWVMCTTSVECKTVMLSRKDTNNRQYQTFAQKLGESFENAFSKIASL
jgi:hypothetical protein